MVTLQLTDEQVVDLVKQLPPDRQEAVYRHLLAQQWPTWANGAAYAAERARDSGTARSRLGRDDGRRA